jgi:hypothetical protein
MIRSLWLSTRVLVIAATVTVACSPSGAPTDLKELHRVQSGNLNVVVLSSNDSVRQGTDTIFVEFRSASDNQLVDVGDVRASATMPMAGMAPMVGNVDVEPTGTAGRYSLTTSLSMTGDWQVAIEWNGPAGSGSASVSTSAQ